MLKKEILLYNIENSQQQSTNVYDLIMMLSILTNYIMSDKYNLGSVLQLKSDKFIFSYTNIFVVRYAS